MKSSALLALLLLSLICIAQTGADPELQAAVNAGNQTWIDGMRRGDASAMASIFTADAVNCSADGQCVTGIANIEAQFRSRLAAMGRTQSGNATITNLVRDRDLAYEWGVTQLNYPGGSSYRGRYVTVWQRQAGGQWKILRNMSLPEEQMARGRPTRTPVVPQRQEQNASLRCESNDMGRHSCAVQYQVSRVEMTRQISGSPCVKDTTWGWTANSVWVDRGCRADFTVYGYVNDAAQAPPVEPGMTEYNDTRTTKNIRCESDDMGYKLCAAGGSVRRARLARQLSGSACTETKTWGWKAEGVWVDKGCRAEFEVIVRE